METMSRLLHRSIKNQIRNLFIFSLLITMCIISVIIFYYWKISIDGAMQYAQEETAQAVLQGIKNFVDVPLKLNENNRYFLEKGLLDINNEKNIMGPLSRPLRKFLSVSSNKVSLRSKTAEVEIIWDLIT
ncbi:hypothetical protein [Pectinatus frisingensis]|uniref:hypothetical protein n=1 Tax=Pectinatus frisingensis TaxID=865 RepID=UPI0015F383AF|nr:hypothetical protein [Pectinatus frisingensis]